MSSAGNLDPSEVQLILDIIAAGRQANYSNMAAMCLLVFDYLLTLRQEIDLVWTIGRWGVTTISFLLFRYLAMGALIFNQTVYVNTTATLAVCFIFIFLFLINCAPAIRFQVATYSSIIGLTEAFLAVRVWIMYERSKYVAGVLIAVLLGNWATITAFNLKVFGGKLTGSPFPPPLSTGCDTIGIPIPNLLFLQIVPRAITAVILFGFTANKTFWAVRQSRRHTPTLTLVLRDGVMYFAVAVIIEFINGMFYRFARLSNKGAVSGFEVIIQYMITCRMFFNIRSFLLYPDDHDPDANGNDTYGIGRSKSIRFASIDYTPSSGFTATTYTTMDWTTSRTTQRDVVSTGGGERFVEGPIPLEPLNMSPTKPRADAEDPQEP